MTNTESPAEGRYRKAADRAGRLFLAWLVALETILFYRWFGPWYAVAVMLLLLVGTVGFVIYAAGIKAGEDE